MTREELIIVFDKLDKEEGVKLYKLILKAAEINYNSKLAISTLDNSLNALPSFDKSVKDAYTFYQVVEQLPINVIEPIDPLPITEAYIQPLYNVLVKYIGDIGLVEFQKHFRTCHPDSFKPLIFKGTMGEFCTIFYENEIINSGRLYDKEVVAKHFIHSTRGKETPMKANAINDRLNKMPNKIKKELLFT